MIGNIIIMFVTIILNFLITIISLFGIFLGLIKLFAIGSVFYIIWKLMNHSSIGVRDFMFIIAYFIWQFIFSMVLGTLIAIRDELNNQ